MQLIIKIDLDTVWSQEESIGSAIKSCIYEKIQEEVRKNLRKDETFSRIVHKAKEKVLKEIEGKCK